MDWLGRSQGLVREDKMTYKKIVEMLVEDKAKSWLEKVLGDNLVDYDYIFVEGSTLENWKEPDTILWETVLTVKTDGIRRGVIIGGTVDDITGICPSVIWNAKKDILWMAVEKTREDLGIERFEFK